MLSRLGGMRQFINIRVVYTCIGAYDERADRMEEKRLLHSENIKHIIDSHRFITMYIRRDDGNTSLV